MNCIKIVDQNALRESVGIKLKEFLSSGGWVFLSDVAFAEMTKHPIKWKDTLKHSTKILARFPEQVFIVKTVGWIFGEEVRTGIPAHEKLMDTVSTYSTNTFREHLRMMGNENSEFSRKIVQNVGYSQQLADRSYFQGAFNKKHLMLWISMWEELLDVKTKKRLRKDSDKWSCIHYVLLNHDINFMIYAALKVLDIRENIAAVLVSSQSLIYLLMLTNLTYALKWMAFGGIESAKESTIVNDLADADYISLALLFDGIISNENTVNNIYDLLCSLIEEVENAV